jgi:predicted molibdopterin-dependent oxidoreductase YjgC
MTPLAPTIELTLDGHLCRVPSGVTLAAALKLSGIETTRLSVRGDARAPLCGMGVCQECRVWVNGQRRLACQTLSAEGMTVLTHTKQSAGTPS